MKTEYYLPKSKFVPDSHLNLNRRSDNTVRSAIDSIQNLLFDPQASAKIFPLLLEHIASITQSDFSVMLLADKDGIAPIKLREKQQLFCMHNDGGVGFIRASTVSHWVEKNMLPMRSVFFNDPIPQSHASLLINPDQVEALIILPIVSQHLLRGICILGKRIGCYTGDIVTRLNPLLGSVICALQSADSVKGNLLSLNQKISDNRFLSTLLSTSPIAIVVIDDDKRIIVSNNSAYHMFSSGEAPLETEASSATLNDIRINELIPKFDDLFKWSNQPDRYGEITIHTEPRIWEEQKAYRLDQSTFWVNISVFRYTHGNQRYTTLQIIDISQMRESAEEYQQTSQQLSALTHLVPVGILRVDADWHCVYANDKWYEFSGLIHEESRGTGWINALHSDDVKTILENLREALQVGSDYQAELRLVSPLGLIRWVDFNTQVLFDERGAVQGFLATFADITERLLHQERLRHVAEYDSLTGLANRNLFQDRLQQAFFASDRDQFEVTIFFLDLDGFKDVNDTLGHDTGDKLLQQVAERLLNTLRRSDTIARFGGDEFIVLLSHSEKDNDVASVASKVIEAVAQPYFIEGNDVYITASIGIASGTSETSSIELIFKQADAALYLAKAEGKNNFQLFNDELDKEAKHRIHLAKQLRRAYKQNRFYLVYQPQATICGQQIIGFEALLRFRDDQNQTILPNDFIPVLEEIGMIVEIGQWVIEEACKQLKLWQNQNQFPNQGFLSINVSPRQLLDDSIISVIINACNKYQVDPQQLIIEITETVIINKPQKVQTIMKQLKEIGVKLALDDFGTGYSSLTYLQRYPFDHIKIDKSFVEDLLTDENDAKITKAIIALAKSLGLKITAEGVTDQGSLDTLKTYGANYYQGYLLGKPVLAEQAIQAALIDHSSDADTNIVSIRKSVSNKENK